MIWLQGGHGGYHAFNFQICSFLKRGVFWGPPPGGDHPHSGCPRPTTSGRRLRNFSHRKGAGPPGPGFRRKALAARPPVGHLWGPPAVSRQQKPHPRALESPGGFPSHQTGELRHPQRGDEVAGAAPGPWRCDRRGGRGVVAAEGFRNSVGGHAWRGSHLGEVRVWRGGGVLFQREGLGGENVFRKRGGPVVRQGPSLCIWEGRGGPRAGRPWAVTFPRHHPPVGGAFPSSRRRRLTAWPGERRGIGGKIIG